MGSILGEQRCDKCKAELDSQFKNPTTPKEVLQFLDIIFSNEHMIVIRLGYSSDWNFITKLLDFGYEILGSHSDIRSRHDILFGFVTDINAYPIITLKKPSINREVVSQEHIGETA